MYCPTSKEFPLLPHDKNGWPWTEEPSQLPDSMADGAPWPKISIVTPSLNQGQFIEETIRSVLLQGYPNLEYIIIDGGSKDGSIDIIKKYEKWLTYWVSEPDKGQSHAINKGFSKASGEIFAFINSDDLYEPGAFETVALSYTKNNKPKLLAGSCLIFSDDDKKEIVKPWWPKNLSYFLHEKLKTTCPQPATFWSNKVFFEIKGMDISLNYCFDGEFFLRIGLTGITPCFIQEILARFRDHEDSKSRKLLIKFYEESIRIIEKHAKACHISRHQKKKKIINANIEIRYLRVFIDWKEKGRYAAFLRFLNMILKCPWVIRKRKIIGLARRLFTFKTENVIELEQF